MEKYSPKSIFKSLRKNSKLLKIFSIFLGQNQKSHGQLLAICGHGVFENLFKIPPTFISLKKNIFENDAPPLSNTAFKKKVSRRGVSEAAPQSLFKKAHPLFEKAFAKKNLFMG